MHVCFLLSIDNEKKSRNDNYFYYVKYITSTCTKTTILIDLRGPRKPKKALKGAYFR